MGAKYYRAMRRAEQRHSPQRIAKPRELSWLLPQFGTISMKGDGGAKGEFLHTRFQSRGGKKA